MSLFTYQKSKKEQMQEQRRRRRGDSTSPAARWFNPWQVVGLVSFLMLAVLVTLICFANLSTTTQQVNPLARVVADFPFTYTSAVQTALNKNLAREQVGPSYFPPDLANEDRLKQAILELESALNQYEKDAATQTPDQQAAARGQIARDFSAKHGFDLKPNDILDFTAKTDADHRAKAFDEAMSTVHTLLSRGISAPTQSGLAAPFISAMEASREFHINLDPLDVDAGAKSAIFNLLTQALLPNVKFDQDRTKRQKDVAMNAVPDVVIQVPEGTLLLDPAAQSATDEQREKLAEYYAQVSQHADQARGSFALLVQRFLFTAMLLLSAVIFIKSGLGHFERSPKFYALAALLLVINLTMLRLVLDLGETSMFAQRPNYLAILPWIAPTMLAPILVTVMIGAAPAVLMALLISMLFAMMTGDTLEIFLVNFLAALVAVHFCRDVRVRIRLVRAGMLGGLAAAVCAAYLGFLNGGVTPGADIGRQMFAATLTGLLTAVAAIGLLPLFENTFKITTDITLLELTDFNHPLLRRLQLAAPGTYHHSLMVANLSERAAAEIGANPLLCRACALYHDIGKLVKPEYFSENQRDGFNPHEGVSPSMSALIIKSHVTEGLDLAGEYKLPKVVHDVIVQHHGTTLIKFFYQKASRQQRLLTQTPFPRGRTGSTLTPFHTGNTPPPVAPAPAPEVPPGRDDPTLDQSSYRYDGPKPAFKESAIIALADCLEAASRALRKVSPLAVEELVETLVNDRLEDHQLDDSPITIQELKNIKRSFNITLLNMLHTRVQYPENEAAAITVKDTVQPGQSPTPLPAPKVAGPASPARSEKAG